MKCHNCGIHVNYRDSSCPNCQKLLVRNNNNNTIVVDDINVKKYKRSKFLNNLELCESIILFMSGIIFFVGPILLKILFFPFVIAMCGSSINSFFNCGNKFSFDPFIFLIFVLGFIFLIINYYIYKKISKAENYSDVNLIIVYDNYILLIISGLLLSILFAIFIIIMK